MTVPSSKALPCRGAFRPALSRTAGPPAFGAAVFSTSGATATGVAVQKAAAAAIGRGYGSVAGCVAGRPSGSASCIRLRVDTAFFGCCGSASGPTGSTVPFAVLYVLQTNPIPSSFAICAGEILWFPLPFFACL